MLSGVALVLLSLLGYALGAIVSARVPASRVRDVHPTLADTLTIPGVIVAGFAARAAVSPWGAAALSAGAAAAIALVLHRAGAADAEGSGEFALLDRDAETRQPDWALGRAWRTWTRCARQVGDFQARVLLGLFFFLAIAPLALWRQRTSDPLQRKGKAEGSFWSERETAAATLERARKQF